MAASKFLILTPDLTPSFPLYLCPSLPVPFLYVRIVTMDLQEFLRDDSEEQLDGGEAPGADWPAQGGVRFEDVIFRYNPSDPHSTELYARKDKGPGGTTRGLDLDIKGGDKVGIVGRRGSGKSTLVNLLFRLARLEQGRILIDGKDLRTLNAPAMRRHIGFVPQSPVIFTEVRRRPWRWTLPQHISPLLL